MSNFLDKIKKDTPDEQDITRLNPFARTNPLAGAAKPNPFVNPFKKATAATENSNTEADLEFKKEKAAEELNRILDSENPAEFDEIMKKKAEEETVEESSAETAKSEDVTEDASDVTEDASTENKEDGEVKAEVSEPAEADEKKEPKKRRRRKSSKTEEPTQADFESSENTALAEDTVVAERASVEEALSALQPIITDDEWKELMVKSQEAISQIVIDSDMNSATLKQALCDIDAVRHEIWRTQLTIKSMLESLTSKDPEGLFERIRRTNSVGANEDERKKAGIKACENYYDPNIRKVVNLYDVIDYLRHYHNFFKGAMDMLDSKQSLLITMSAVLKLEKNLSLNEN